MSLEKRFVDRDVLDSDHPAPRLQVENPVHHDEWIAVGNDLEDPADVEDLSSGLFRDPGDGAGHRHIALVAGPIGDQVRLDPPAHQPEIAQDVTGLVAHELIGPAQRAAEDVGVREHHRRGRRGALEQAAAPQGFHFAGEAEGAGSGEVLPEGIEVDVPGAGLPADERVTPLDGGGEPERGRRGDDVGRVAFGHGERRNDPERGGLSLQGIDAGALEQLQVRGEGTVQNRRLRPVELDHQIVQLQRHHRSQQVLNGVDGGFAAADRGAPLGGLDLAYPGRDFGTRFEVDAPKHDALARRAGPAGDPGAYAGVQADPGDLRCGRDRPPRHRCSALSRGPRADR